MVINSDNIMYTHICTYVVSVQCYECFCMETGILYNKNGRLVGMYHIYFPCSDEHESYEK